MKMSRDHWLLATAVALCVAGCATVPPGPPPEVVRLQTDLDRLHGDPVIADNGGNELANADAAVDVLSRNARMLDARSYEQGVYIADKLIGIAEASALARAAEHRGAELGIERERLLAQNAAGVGTTTIVTTVPQRVVGTDSGELVPRARAELMAMQNQLPGVESRLDARGLVIRLGDYMFEPGRPELTPTAEESLDAVARVLRNDTDAGIAVEAFGADGLADRRADSVRDYLDARGVDPARIATRRVGYATLAENDRRVDIVIRSDIR